MSCERLDIERELILRKNHSILTESDMRHYPVLSGTIFQECFVGVSLELLGLIISG